MLILGKVSDKASFTWGGLNLPESQPAAEHKTDLEGPAFRVQQHRAMRV